MLYEAVGPLEAYSSFRTRRKEPKISAGKYPAYATYKKTTSRWTTVEGNFPQLLHEVLVPYAPATFRLNLSHTF